MKYIITIIAFSFISCKKEKPILIGTGTDATVNLKLTDKENFKNLSFSSNNIDTIIYSKDLKSATSIKFSFDLLKDKSFFLHTVTITDTFSILSTIQKGKNTTLILNKDTLKHLRY